MTAYDAYRIAVALAHHDLTDSDAVTHADIDAAADYTNTPRPDGTHDRTVIRIALDAITASA